MSVCVSVCECYYLSSILGPLMFVLICFHRFGERYWISGYDTTRHGTTRTKRIQDGPSRDGEVCGSVCESVCVSVIIKLFSQTWRALPAGYDRRQHDTMQEYQRWIETAVTRYVCVCVCVCVSVCVSVIICRLFLVLSCLC